MPDYLPDIDEQDAIARIFVDVDHEIDSSTATSR